MGKLTATSWEPLARWTTSTSPPLPPPCRRAPHLQRRGAGWHHILHFEFWCTAPHLKAGWGRLADVVDLITGSSGGTRSVEPRWTKWQLGDIRDARGCQPPLLRLVFLYYASQYFSVPPPSISLLHLYLYFSVLHLAACSRQVYYRLPARTAVSA